MSRSARRQALLSSTSSCRIGLAGLVYACGYLAANYQSRIIAGRQRLLRRLAGAGTTRTSRRGRCKRRGSRAAQRCICVVNRCKLMLSCLAARRPLSASHRPKPWSAGLIACCTLSEPWNSLLLLWRERAALSPPHRSDLTCPPRHSLTTAVRNTAPPLPPWHLICFFRLRRREPRFRLPVPSAAPATTPNGPSDERRARAQPPTKGTPSAALITVDLPSPPPAPPRQLDPTLPGQPSSCNYRQHHLLSQHFS